MGSGFGFGGNLFLLFCSFMRNVNVIMNMIYVGKSVIRVVMICDIVKFFVIKSYGFLKDCER